MGRYLVLLPILLIFTVDLLAKDMYKYQDENDTWVFTDVPPNAASNRLAAVETQRMEFYEPTRLVRIQNNGPRNNPQLYGINDAGVPVEVEIRFLDSTKQVRLNGSNTQKRFRAIVAPGRQKLLVSIDPTTKNQWYYEYESSFAFGTPASKTEWNKDNGYLYGLPFDSKKQFLVAQGFNGSFSHNKEYNRYAVDIAMRPGTPIVASRSGIVIAYQDYFFRSGIEKKYRNRSNYIQILHDDQTTAGYYHLGLDSVIVKPGQRVEKEQMLATSGDTGYSSGPHLHFVIQQNQNTTMVSIPFKFSGGENGRTPAKGIYIG